MDHATEQHLVHLNNFQYELAFPRTPLQTANGAINTSLPISQSPITTESGSTNVVLDILGDVTLGLKSV